MLKKLIKKKFCLILILLFFIILINFNFVYADDGGKSPSTTIFSCDKTISKELQGLVTNKCQCHPDFDKTKDSDIIWQFPIKSKRMYVGDKYCNINNGEYGIIKECESSSGTDSQGRNNDCYSTTTPTGIPFCKDNKCNECRLSSASTDCNLNLPNIIQKKCLTQKFFDKKDMCNYCRRILGTGDKKITFVIINAPDKQKAVEVVVADINSRQPFGYLSSKNVFTFQLAFGDEFGFIPSIKNPSEMYTGSGVKSEVKDQILAYANNVCGTSNHIIFIDYNWPIKYSYFDTKNIFGSGNKIAVIHELGHVVGDLGDEYYIATRSSRWEIESFQRSGINVEEDYILSYDIDVCPKFDKENIPKKNCYASYGYFDKTGTRKPGKDYRFSTDSSIMGAKGADKVVTLFNTISCMGLLNKAVRMDYEAGRKLCTQWACEDPEKIHKQTQQCLG